MAKKRRTRQEKIIRQLKRQIASQGKNFEPSQGGVSVAPSQKEFFPDNTKKTSISNLSFDPHLIKKDILKTLISALAVISLEVVLYLKLR